MAPCRTTWRGLVAGLATLLLVALVATRLGALGRGRELVVVTVRAIVQILLVGLVIAAVLRTPALAPVYLGVMLVVATATSARRIRVPGRSWQAAGAAIAAGSVLTVLVVVLTRAIPFDVRHVVPLSAQVVGGAMTATSLAGQRFVDQVADRVGGDRGLARHRGHRGARPSRSRAGSRPRGRWSRPSTRPATSDSSPCPGRMSVCCSRGPARWTPGGCSSWSSSGCWPPSRWPWWS